MYAVLRAAVAVAYTVLELTFYEASDVTCVFATTFETSSNSTPIQPVPPHRKSPKRNQRFAARGATGFIRVLFRAGDDIFSPG